MQWTKIPTNLLNGKFDDKEILAIVKYQLAIALYEEELSDKILNRFLTKNQQKIVKNYCDDILVNVKNEVQQTNKKRNGDKLRYAKNKEKTENSVCENDNETYSVPPEQIRLDKIRLDNKKENLIKEKKVDPFINPVKTFFQEQYTKIMGKSPRLSLIECNRLVELANENQDIKEIIPIAIKRLKAIDFKDIQFTPSASWLLKGNNFERVINGEFEPKKSEYDRLKEKFCGGG